MLAIRFSPWFYMLATFLLAIFLRIFFHITGYPAVSIVLIFIFFLALLWAGGLLFWRYSQYLPAGQQKVQISYVRLILTLSNAIAGGFVLIMPALKSSRHELVNLESFIVGAIFVGVPTYTITLICGGILNHRKRKTGQESPVTDTTENEQIK